MINLLNPETKRSIRAARINVQLRNFLIGMFAAICCLAVVFTFGFWSINNQQQLADTEQKKAKGQLSNYKNTISEAKNYQSNLSIAKQILSNEIVFSNFLIKTAQAMPPNTIISNLTLTTKAQTGNSKSTQVQARAKSYDDVLKLKENFQNSPLFSDVKLVSTNRQVDNGTSRIEGIQATYPFTATLSVVINSGATK